ncbi:MAG TPA: bifunctional UDP-N-acetylglucosamine diphosphorylase/glucosamine-1-phosphate N-acetyltransferase GlmU [Myxococcota bacterium]|nr:bifunctional UDP-N-acetylglucosamine diphosphorylase/glucosamine-1-phosphate N-acetyltransferase GlmU [Myxococcota bacterium]
MGKGKAVPLPVAVVILAAGQGTRMKSGLAKVLHPIAGRPMLGYPLAAAEALGAARIAVVVGRDAAQVEAAFAGRAAFALQREQRGTGHALLQAEAALGDFDGDLLVLYGDTPLLRVSSLREMIERKRATGADLVMLSARVAVPGIVVRDAAGRLARIVEATDASPTELEIPERNTGVYLASRALFWKALAQADDRNAQGEIYLTSVVEILLREGRRIEVMPLEDDAEGTGINTRVELARAAAVVRERKLEELMLAGVTIVDPASTWIDVDVEVGRDSVIEPGCALQGATRLGERVHLKPHCVIESSEIGDECELGPSAHLRPGNRLGPGVRIGNFVELKNSTLGAGVKADHLTYVGDTDAGDGATFGCGAITVNYDWRSKHRTRVGERAAIGCNANLIAPLCVGKDAAVAAGTTVTKDVPDGALAVERGETRHVLGWALRLGREGKQKKSKG